MSLTHLDLFSGIGGFALAARWAAINTIAFCEKDEFCQKVLNKNFPDIPVYGEIREMRGIHANLLTAGFPCQPFSVAGKQKGKNDDRYLWPEVIRIIRVCIPDWIILENVPGIIPHLDTILKDLERETYNWRTFLIPASAVGAPHKRERIWIVANYNGQRCNNGINNWEKRYIQIDWQQHIKTIQPEWTQFQPESWTTFNAQEWLGLTTDSNSKSMRQANKRTITEPEEGNARERYSGQHRESQPLFNWQKDKPPVPGMDDGVSNGLDRNKALGNAIVPQIAYLLMRLILAIEKV